MLEVVVPSLPLSETADEYLERDGRIERRLVFGDEVIHSSVQLSAGDAADLKGAWWRSYLVGHRPIPLVTRQGQVRTVDLFSGPGGLANGISQFFKEAGLEVVSELAVDRDGEATKVYAANHGARQTTSVSVADLVDFAVRRGSGKTTFHYRPELTDDALSMSLRGVDIVLAGPPCQGHSNLNNHTRRSDPRNTLYLTVPAFAVAIDAPVVIIENVPAVLHDTSNVVGTARALLESEGYMVEEGVLNAAQLGWAQARRRHFLVARKRIAPLQFTEVLSVLGDESPRSVWWAISDLEYPTGQNVLDRVTAVSEVNQERINWLFSNDEHNLALSERPASHRNGTTYMSVYGRMRKAEPSPTITTGFMSPGRGRFVHPTRPRVLTAREAARLQGFPDDYRFVVDSSVPPGSTLLSKWIGDAVPMPLGFAAACSAFGGGLPRSAEES